MNNVISCFTDGSNLLDQLSSWAFIAVQNDKIIHQDSGVLTGEICSIRNIGGEIFAVVSSIKWAKNNNTSVDIYYDYTGLKMWINDLFGESPWKCNNKWSIKYRDFMFKNKSNINSMIWIKGHSSNKWNDYVDKLASDTLKGIRQ